MRENLKTRFQTSSFFFKMASQKSKHILYCTGECGRRNELHVHTLMLNEREVQFIKWSVHCKVMRQLKTLKNIDDLAPKQTMYR